MEQCVERYCKLVDSYLAKQDAQTYRALQREQETYLAFKATLTDPSTNRHVLKFKRYKAKLRASNDVLLEHTKYIHAKTTQQLQQGLQTIENAKEHASVTIAHLSQDRERIQDWGSLDRTQAELQRSQGLLTRIIKVISTNKILSVLSLFAVAFAIAIVILKTR